jgi:hypothetical protein
VLLKREMSVVALASLFFFSFVADERMFTDLLITSLIGGFTPTNPNFTSTLLTLEQMSTEALSSVTSRIALVILSW